MIEKLGMPKWGLSMKEGRLVAWLVEEGAELAVGDEVAEVETEKINGVVEAPAAGTLRRRVAAVGDVVPVGGLLGVLADASASEAEVDEFVERFRASFVPEEGEEEGAAYETLTVGGRTLRYARSGDGEDAVVLLHGFGGDLDGWLFNTEALAAARTVYAVDLPGHGGSGKDVGAGDLDTLAGAVSGFLDALGLERVHLVGHSLGGAVAVAVALTRPERVLSLALLAPVGFGEEIDAEYLEGFVRAQTRRELKPFLERLFADPAVVTRQLVDDVLRYKRIDGVEAALRAISAACFPGGRQGVRLAERLGELGVPVLVVWGEADRIVPSAQAAAAPAGARVELLAGQGHSPHMEAASEVNRLLEEFLGSVPRAAAA